MIVVDLKKTLIANSDDNISYHGTFTENRYLASIIAEHIHHDIYLLKLKKKYEKDLIDKDILIDSLLENRDERDEFLKKD